MTTSMTGSDPVPATWPDTLDVLEADVVRLEGLLDPPTSETGPGFTDTDVLGGWVPPVGLGPLPEDLRVRATHLLQRQLSVAETLVEQITKSKQQRDVAARMSHTPNRPAAAFIDQSL